MLKSIWYAWLKIFLVIFYFFNFMNSRLVNMKHTQEVLIHWNSTGDVVLCLLMNLVTNAAIFLI